MVVTNRANERPGAGRGMADSVCNGAFNGGGPGPAMLDEMTL